MRFRNIARFSMLSTVIATLVLGCGQGTEVEGVKVPPQQPPPPESASPLPKEMKKGGGPGSSGNLKRNPGADPLKH